MRDFDSFTVPKKPIYHRCLAIALLFASRTAIAEEPVLDERRLVIQACQSGPDAKLALLGLARGSAAITAAGVLPNPALWAEHQQTLSGPEDQQTIVGLDIPLGISGRYFILRDAAAAQNERAMADADASLFSAALELRAAYVEAAIDTARARVVEEQQLALDKLTQTIKGLSKGGELSAYDSLRQETQARAHLRELLAMKARADDARTTLEAWLGARLSFEIAPFDLAASSGAVDIEAAVARHPQLRGYEAAAKASALETRAAQRKWVPDLDVLAGYRQVTVGEETGRGVSVSLTVPLTFFDHGQGEAALAEAEASIATATAERFRVLNAHRLRAVSARLDTLLAGKGDTSASEALLVRDQAIALYAAGEATITELLEAFRAAEDAQLAELSFAEEIAQVRITRMRLAGSFFDAELDAACAASSRGSP